MSTVLTDLMENSEMLFDKEPVNLFLILDFKALFGKK